MLAVVNSLLTVNNITDMMIQGETDTDRIKQVNSTTINGYHTCYYLLVECLDKKTSIPVIYLDIKMFQKVTSPLI